MSNGPKHSGKDYPFTVVLTGGIASGKTLISDEFAKLGVPVIDTDIIARNLVEPGRPALKEIEQAFGANMIDSSGRLKRAEMRAIIFSDSKKRKQLEAILHPRIRYEADKAVASVTSAYCVLVIPLLAERGVYPFIDHVLVVDVDPETQISRLMKRDNISRLQAELALASQASREQRLLLADDVLDNSVSIEKARNEVKLLHKKYQELAIQHHLH